MDHRLDVMGGEYPAQPLLVPDIAFIKGEILPRQLLDPAQRLRFRVVVVVDHHDIAARLEQLNTGVAADIAAAPRNQNGHARFLL